MTCHRFDDCYFPKLYNDLKHLFKDGYEETSWIYHNCCINYTQAGCTLSKLDDIEFKVFERDFKTNGNLLIKNKKTRQDDLE